jgi:RNA polymerase sigma-70 factor (ECF subfamily)
MSALALPTNLFSWCSRISDSEELEAKSDEELIRALTDQDHEPFRILVRRYKDRIFGMVMRQLGERTAAEDLAQEIFIRAFQGLPKFRADSTFSTWLTRIALNQVHSFFTSRRFRELQRSHTFDLEKHDHGGSGQDESNETDETQLQLFRSALARLKPIHRDSIVLCGIEGRSYEDAAAILKIPVGTVRSRLSHARQQLQQLISQL